MSGIAGAGDGCSCASSTANVLIKAVVSEATLVIRASHFGRCPSAHTTPATVRPARHGWDKGRGCRVLLADAGDRSPSSAAHRKIVRDLPESRITLPRVPDHVPLANGLAGSAARGCSQSICSACQVLNRPCLLLTGTHSANSRKQTGLGRGPAIKNRSHVLVAPGASVNFLACRCLKVTYRNRESWGADLQSPPGS